MLALGVAAVLLLVGRALAGVYADYLWYDALGAGALWRAARRRRSRRSTRRLGRSSPALFAFANLYAVRQSVVSLVFPRRVGNLEIGEEVPGQVSDGRRRRAVAIARRHSARAAAATTGRRSCWRASDDRSASRIPYFGADLGFFVYWLPFENTLWNWAFIVRDRRRRSP